MSYVSHDYSRFSILTVHYTLFDDSAFTKVKCRRTQNGAELAQSLENCGWSKSRVVSAMNDLQHGPVDVMMVGTRLDFATIDYPEGEGY